MSTILPTDSNDHVIPALRLKDGAAQTISATGTTAKNATAFNASTRVVTLYADVPVYLAFGDSSVTATASDHYFPEGTYYSFSIGGDGSAHSTHVAALAFASNGTVYISEME